MDKNAQAVIHKFREIIIRCGYSDLYSTYGSLHSIDVPHPMLQKQNIDFPEPVNNFIRLFLLGKPCPYIFLEELFNHEEIHELCKMGILKKEKGDEVSSPLVLMSFMGYLIFFERMGTGGDIGCYMGDDSIALATHLMPPSGGRCLDLCTGSGIQALICASRAKRTVAVDIQERAVELATLNVYLNRLENRVKIQKGNLYDAIGGDKFDFICANPPLLPSANRLKSPLVAAGGEDGLDLTRQILYGLPNYLVPGGTCQMLGTSLGDERGPFLEQELNQLSTFLNCSFIAIFTIAYPLSWMLNPLAGNSSIFCGENFITARLAYQKLFERFNASHIFPFYLTAVHEKDKKSEVSILPQYRTTWDGFWTVNG